MNKRFKDISGQVFGYLTAIEPTDQRSSGSSIVWRCRCDCLRNTCPKIVYVSNNKLSKGDTRSCRNQQHDKTIHAAIRRYFGNTRHGAKLRGYIFDLSLTQFHDLIKQACYYCGDNTDIKQIRDRNTSKYWDLRANGIDRFDNTLGYTIDNCVACCERCNYMKQALTAQTYIEHCYKVIKHNERIT